MKREKVDKHESLWLLAIVTWRYPIWVHKWLGAMSVMFPVCKAPRPHSCLSEEFLHSTILRLKACQPSSQYEWSVDGRLQPLVDQYKPIQHQTFAIEKFRDLIGTARSCPGDKKSFKKIKSLTSDPWFAGHTVNNLRGICSYIATGEYKEIFDGIYNRYYNIFLAMQKKWRQRIPLINFNIKIFLNEKIYQSSKF